MKHETISLGKFFANLDAMLAESTARNFVGLTYATPDDGPMTIDKMVDDYVIAYMVERNWELVGQGTGGGERDLEFETDDITTHLELVALCDEMSNSSGTKITHTFFESGEAKWPS